MNLSINGGEGNKLAYLNGEIYDIYEIFFKAFAASVWVNGVFLGASFGK